MYEELVRRLRELASIPEHCEDVEACYQCPKEGICLSFTNKQIIEVTTQVADAIEELIDQNDTAYSKGWENGERAAKSRTPRWIPVTERLPNVGEIVIVYTHEPILTRVIWLDRMVISNKNETPYWANHNGRVLYWMPLPEPPKDGE